MEGHREGGSEGASEKGDEGGMCRSELPCGDPC